MGLEIAVRERATKATRLLVDDQPVNPWLVGIDFALEGSLNQSVELRLGLPILFFEMKQYGEAITIETVLTFVSDDLKNHKNEALDVYLTIVRYVVNPPPRRKSHGWFARMFSSPPKWTPPTQEWKWTAINDIGLSDDEALIIKGRCGKIAASENQTK